MFDNTVAIAANTPTPALNFTLVQTDGLGANRLDVVNNYAMNVNHTKPTITKPEKHYLQVTQTVVANNPLVGTTSIVTASASLSVSIPSNGWTRAQKIALVQALLDTLADSQVTIGGLIDYNS